jgi:L-gulono-1,4-lactone dehydrogenase
MSEPPSSRFVRSDINPLAIIYDSHVHTHQLVLRPKDRGELKMLMETAASNHRPLKIVGRGLALSDIEDTIGYRIEMNELCDVHEVDAGVLQDPQMISNLCEFDAGASIEQINSFLRSKGHALRNQPGFEKLTFCGVALTGGHGTGIRLGPLSSAVRSLTLFVFDKLGKVIELRLEPKAGITDKTKFAADPKYKSVKLIQDDVVFNTATVSLGYIGAIHSMIIETQSYYYLTESRQLLPWSEIVYWLKHNLNEPKVHSCHVWLNPYEFLGQQYGILGSYGPTSEEKDESASRGAGITNGSNQELVDAMLYLSRMFPAITPGLVQGSLKSTENPWPLTMPCEAALNFGPPNLLQVSNACNYGVPVESTTKFADELSKAFQQHSLKTDQYLLSPFGLRFVASTEAYMSPMYRQDTCMVEMPLLDNLYGSENLLAVYRTIAARFQARPHWGQRNEDVTRTNLSQRLPKAQKFSNALFRCGDPTRFRNQMSERLGLFDR